MKWFWLVALPFAIACMGLSCGGRNEAAANPPPERHPEYSFGFFNATDSLIRDAMITWSWRGTTRPSGGGVVSPAHFKVSHFEPRPVPEKVKLTWKTADGKQREQMMNVSDRVPDVEQFHGTIWFKFVPDGSVQFIPLTYAEQDQRAVEQKPYP